MNSRPAFRTVFFSAAILASSACPGSDLQVTSDLVTQYENLARPAGHTPAVSNEIDCYLDFSTGMGEGMRATAETNDRLKNFLGGRQAHCFKIGAVIEPAPITLGMPEANFIDLRNYTEAGSKLKIAVDRMTTNAGRVSFVITDFERVEDVTLRQNLPGAPEPHPIDASAWAQNAFREWLLAGHRLDVFAVPYQKPDYWFDRSRRRTYANWIYTIVTTPAAIALDPGAYRASLTAFLEEEYRRRPPAGARQFTFDGRAFVVEQRGGGTNGNANANLVVQEARTGTFDRGFEYYAVESTALLAFAHDASLNDKRIISGIKVSSRAPYLADVTFGIRVYDVTNALTSLDAVLGQGAPEVRTDVETGKADTVANKPVAPTFDKGTPVDSVFDVIYNTETKELGIKLKPDYAGTGKHAVYRIEMIVSSAALKEDADAAEVMALQYANGYRVRALAESVRLALRDLVARLPERTLHTVYIDITP